MLVAEAMSRSVVSVHPETTVKEALRRLDEYGITSMPVVDDAGALVGLVSEADLVLEAVVHDSRASMLHAPGSTRARARTVAQVMNYHPITVDPHTDLADAVELMTSSEVKSLPVVEEHHVVGMISRRDVVHALARDDDDIETEIVELLQAAGTDWLVEVDNGVVDIIGPITDREHRLAEALASTVAGVAAVRVRAGTS